MKNMTKIETLISLINSLTKSEKKSFSIYNSRDSEYYTLFSLISNNKNISPSELKKKFLKNNAESKYETSVNYLYKLILNTLLSLREEQDTYYNLLNRILKARILFEKSLFEEALDSLRAIKQTALEQENNFAYLYASRLELDYLMYLDFPEITETDLLRKHIQIGESLKKIRRTNEQSELYELLKHRSIYIDNIRSIEQKKTLSDLVFSELSLSASSPIDSFEINRKHLLFQANYLIAIGDYQSAIQTFYELNNLLEDNKHLLANPPIYYLDALEGILNNLRIIGEYKEMEHFIDRLKQIEYPALNFQTNVKSLIFLYTLCPLLDKGCFSQALQIIHLYQESVIDKIYLLSLPRQAEVILHTSLVYIGLKNYEKARKSLQMIMINSKAFYKYPLFRTIRLIRLIIYYETNQYNLCEYEIRSLKRELSKQKKIYKTETIMLHFLGKGKGLMVESDRIKEWAKHEEELVGLRESVFEKQILKFFDFTAWLEAKILRKSLATILERRIL